MKVSKEAAIIGILVLCLLALYSLDRTRLGQSIPDEKRYIQSTREMVEGGDYVTPRYHGKLRFQKPILFYWLIILSYKLFGVGVFAARFSSIAASLFNIILIYLLGRDLFGKKAGIFSALILSTSEVYFMYSRFATPDMTFLLFIAASIYFFLKAYRNDIKGNFRYLYMYVCMALATLTKGPLGFIYPMMAVCFFLIIKRDWAVFKELNFILGLLIFAIISAPWFIAMIMLHGNEYIDKVWSLEIIKKLKSSSLESNENFLVYYLRSSLYYIGMIFARNLPWAAFLPASLLSIKSFSCGRPKKEIGHAFIWAWFIAVFISLVLVRSRESYYVLALSMPISLFLGNYFAGFSTESRLSKSILFKLPYILAIAACFLALFLWLFFIVYILDKPIFSFSLLMLIIPILMVRAYSNNNKILLPLSFFIASFVFLGYFAGYVIPTVDQEPLLEVAEEIRSVIKPGDAVGVASSAVSYHRIDALLEDHKVIRVDKRTIDRLPENLERLKGKGDFINEFLRTEDRRIFCVITKDDYHEFVDESLKERLFIMDKAFIWRRFHKQGRGYFKGLLTYFLEGKREKFKQALKEEIYLLSN